MWLAAIIARRRETFSGEVSHDAARPDADRLAAFAGTATATAVTLNTRPA